MTDKKIIVEYELADITAFAHRSLAGIDERKLSFDRYGHTFWPVRRTTDAAGKFTVQQTQAAIEAEALPVAYATRVFVVLKHLAGAGDTRMPEVRVFSSYAAWEAYEDNPQGDNPSPDDDDVISSMTTCIVDAPAPYWPCTCTEQFYQEGALEALDPAVPGPSSGGQVDARAAAVHPRDASLSLDLQDGRRLDVPRSWFAFLDADDTAQWHNVSLNGTRQFLKWPRFDKQVSIEGLLGVAPKGPS